jgi:hypothetical protein
MSNELKSIIDEFTDAIPDHIDKMPEISSNGTTRNEMEWKYMAKAMAREIITLRSSPWIPVSEGLPDDYAMVLAKISQRVDPVIAYCVNSTWYLYESDNGIDCAIAYMPIAPYNLVGDDEISQ